MLSAIPLVKTVATNNQWPDESSFWWHGMFTLYSLILGLKYPLQLDTPWHYKMRTVDFIIILAPSKENILRNCVTHNKSTRYLSAYLLFVILDNILLGRGLVLVCVAGRFEGEELVLLAEAVSLLKRLGQLGPHGLGQEGGGHGARQADQEQRQVRVPNQRTENI